MALPEADKAISPSFGLEIDDDIQIKQISEVSGLKIEQDVIELKQNTPDGKYIIKKLPGRFKAGEVTLTRRLTKDNSFEAWFKVARSVKVGDSLKDGHIIAYDNKGSVIKRYKLTACWPKSLEIGTLKAGDTSVLVEKLVISYETLQPA